MLPMLAKVSFKAFPFTLPDFRAHTLYEANANESSF